MDAHVFIQLLINGLVVGGIYALVATGFTLVYGTARVLNFAHGHFYMLGAFIYGGIVLNSGHWVLGFVGAVIGLALLGAFVWQLIFKPLYLDFFLTVACSIGIGQILIHGLMVTIGDRDVVVPTIFPGSLQIGRLNIGYEKIAIIGFSLFVMLLLHLFLRTKIGKALEATTIDREAASLMGIDVDQVLRIAMIFGSAMAGIAGAVIVPAFSASITMGGPLTFIFFSIVVVAGHGSIKGAIIVAYIFGLVKTFGYQYIGSLDNVLIFLVVTILIYVRPWGIWGAEWRRTE